MGSHHQEGRRVRRLNLRFPRDAKARRQAGFFLFGGDKAGYRKKPRRGKPAG